LKGEICHWNRSLPAGRQASFVGMTIRDGNMERRNNIFKHIVTGLLLCFFSNSFSQDPTNYPLNDPRNPNCPCHKYQKLAEEEYKKLLAKANPNPVHLNNIPVQKKENKIILNQHGVSSASQNLSQGISDSELQNKNQGVSEAEQFALNPQQGNQIGQLNNGVSESDASDPRQSVNRSSNISHGSVSGGSSFTKKKSHTFTKLKRKKKNSHYKKWKRIFDVKHWEVWKRFIHVSSCYHWN
jgi:hypothetical protein